MAVLFLSSSYSCVFSVNCDYQSAFTIKARAPVRRSFDLMLLMSRMNYTAIFGRALEGQQRVVVVVCRLRRTPIFTSQLGWCGFAMDCDDLGSVNGGTGGSKFCCRYFLRSLHVFTSYKSEVSNY